MTRRGIFAALAALLVAPSTRAVQPKTIPVPHIWGASRGRPDLLYYTDFSNADDGLYLFDPGGAGDFNLTTIEPLAGSPTVEWVKVRSLHRARA